MISGDGCAKGCHETQSEAFFSIARFEIASLIHSYTPHHTRQLNSSNHENSRDAIISVNCILSVVMFNDFAY